MNIGPKGDGTHNAPIEIDLDSSDDDGSHDDNGAGMTIDNEKSNRRDNTHADDDDDDDDDDDEVEIISVKPATRNGNGNGNHFSSKGIASNIGNGKKPLSSSLSSLKRQRPSSSSPSSSSSSSQKINSKSVATSVAKAKVSNPYQVYANDKAKAAASLKWKKQKKDRQEHLLSQSQSQSQSQPQSHSQFHPQSQYPSQSKHHGRIRQSKNFNNNNFKLFSIEPQDQTNPHCQTLREMLGIDDVKQRQNQTQYGSRSDSSTFASASASASYQLEFMIVSNFVINTEFLLQEIPELISIPKLLVFYEHNESARDNEWPGDNAEFRQISPKDEPTKPHNANTNANANTTTNPTKYQHRFGSHHTKLFIVGLRDVITGRKYMRVIVHTANLRYDDLYRKCQGAYIQDFPIKCDTSTINDVNVEVSADISASTCSTTRRTGRTSDFEESLNYYMDSYGYHKPSHWQGSRTNVHPQSCTSTRTHTRTNTDKALTLKQLIALYDFSGANAILIPSIPGYHKLNLPEAQMQGYLKLKNAIGKCTRDSSSACSRINNGKDDGDGDGNGDIISGSASSECNAGPVVCQFSSIGSLSEKWLKEFISSLTLPKSFKSGSTHTGTHARTPEDVRTNTKQKTQAKKKRNIYTKNDAKQMMLTESTVKLVYPTAEDIRCSVEGYRGGGTVPGKLKNVSKSFLRPLFCKWDAEGGADASASSGTNARVHSFETRKNPLHKGNYVPHIKSYYQLASDRSSMEWFVLGSHNLSKPAWGEVINGKYGTCLRVSSWELGVFVCPSSISTRSGDKGGRGRIVPYEYTIVPDGNSSHKNDDVLDAAIENGYWASLGPGLRCGGNDGNGSARKASQGKASVTIGQTNCHQDQQGQLLEDDDIVIPLPFRLDPLLYSAQDEPWATDKKYSIVDKFGLSSLMG